MIITLRSSVSSDERAQLMALLCRLTGNQQHITLTRIDGYEVIALDGSQFDEQAGPLLKQQTPIRTFAQWDEAKPGFLEVDLVAHCGGRLPLHHHAD